MLRSNLLIGTFTVCIVLLSFGQSALAQNLLDKVTEGDSDAAEKVGDVADSAGEAVLEATESMTASEIDSDATTALEKLYAISPETKDLSDSALAVIVRYVFHE